MAPIAAALSDDEQLASIREKLTEGKAKPMEAATLAVMDDDRTTILVERDDWHEWWKSCRARLTAPRVAKSAPTRMRCLLSGELVEPQPTHNKITGLSDVGGLSMGDALASFNKDAFGSYNLQKSANAAMSEQMVKTYTTALNHLIQHHSHRLAGVKIVYWYDRPVEPELDPMVALLKGNDPAPAEKPEATEAKSSGGADTGERIRAENRAAKALSAIADGRHPDLADSRYFALTLSANSGRVVIRDWMEGQFEELARSVDAWLKDLSIVHRHGHSVVEAHKFLAVLAAPLRDLKDAPSPLAASLWHCAIKKQPISHQVMAQTLARVRIDLIQGESPRHARLGLLKAFCNRNERIPNMTTHLNEHETDPAYLCGRIMSILAQIQLKALPDVGAGVVQRYYAAASTTPALVLGRLVRTTQIAHLPKIESDGLRHWFENQLTEVWGKLSQAPPQVLTLAEQTLFAMGYYHQSAHRSKAKNADAAPDDQAKTE